MARGKCIFSIFFLCYFLLVTSAYADDNIMAKENSWRYSNGTPTNNNLMKSISFLSEFQPWSKVDGNFINSNGEVITGAVQKGVDVSSWQGSIDWAKVKATDVDYAIIRCGYGDNFTNYDDPYWYTNANACKTLGIPFGVYIYSYAASIPEAKSEAEHVLRLVKDYNLTFPIYLDMEDNSLSSLTTSDLGAIAKTFCDIVKNAGYEVGIYANKNWWTTKLTDSVFSDPSWYKWVAQYNFTCTYPGSYTMWQCTSSGQVNGIGTDIDLNFWFGEKRSIQASITLGDLNSDSIINSDDAMIILRYDSGLIGLTELEKQNADVSNDGKIDCVDAMVILRYSAGLINTFR